MYGSRLEEWYVIRWERVEKSTDLIRYIMELGIYPMDKGKLLKGVI